MAERRAGGNAAGGAKVGKEKRRCCPRGSLRGIVGREQRGDKKPDRGLKKIKYTFHVLGMLGREK